jgi:formylglycine-generating enzyme
MARHGVVRSPEMESQQPTLTRLRTPSVLNPLPANVASMNQFNRLATSTVVALILVGFGVSNARAVVIDWVTVGDPGNAADTTGYGAVAASFQIMKYEFTNEQYKDFLNSVAATDTYSLYNTLMGSNARGGITRSGSPGSYSYSVRTNMGGKPVNYVNWFDAARVANWLQNGQGSGSTETGAYTLVGGQTSGTAPARNLDAQFYIPTEDQWYKAAYYKGGGTNAGYWDYATQSDTLPTAVNATTVGTGSSGGVSPVTSGNFANHNLGAFWNGQNGNVTTVGTNGAASYYGAFDLSGNVGEYNDLTGASGLLRGIRGGSWRNSDPTISSANRLASDPASASNSLGFRLVTTAVPVPEPSTWVMGLAGIACVAWRAVRRRTR